MSIKSRFLDAWAKSDTVVQARIIPTWQAGRPLPSPMDVDKLSAEGYRANTVVAGCIWAIATSACEPQLVVKRKGKNGVLELAVGPDADALRALLNKPNPEHTTFTFLEQLFTHQQVSGNWFFRKIRAEAGNVVHLWPLHPGKVKIVPNDAGWASRYDFNGQSFPAVDVVHDPLHPSLEDEFWGLSPIAVAARFIDLDNAAGDFLRAFFANNATPAGILKLKAKMDRVDRERIKDLWKQEHTGPNGWTVSVLDADGDYQEIGADATKLRMDGAFNETEARICAAFGVPAIIAGTVIGLTRSTFANYKEARTSFWEDTLTPLYKRCAQRLTEGLCREFDPKGTLVIEFDLSTVEALQENREALRKFALEGWNAGILTLNQSLEMVGQPKVEGEAGEARKAPSAQGQGLPPAPGFAGLLGAARGQEHHARALTGPEKTAIREFKRVAAAHFKAQGEALAAHLKG